jgi:hypothetical protein
MFAVGHIATQERLDAAAELTKRPLVEKATFIS